MLLNNVLKIGLIAVLTLFSAHSAHAIILLPRPQPSGGVAAIEQGQTSVTVTIENNVAKSRIYMEFKNPNPRQQEADVYLPIPIDAGITDFRVSIGGKMTLCEVLESGQAKRIYEEIVRKTRDPGLLEMTDQGLAHVRLFPIPALGTMGMEFELTQLLRSDQGMRKLSIPLGSRAENGVADAQCKLTVDIAPEDGYCVRNVYSPSDTVDVTYGKPPANMTKVSAMRTAAMMNSGKDFVLYYEKPEQAISLGVLCEKDKNSTQGSFMLLFEPPLSDSRSTQTHESKDVIFVIDTSWSMKSDEKIVQAKQSVKSCIAQLHESDRFNVLTFASTVKVWNSAGLMQATAENQKACASWIDEIRATGGTNIAEALVRALKLSENSDNETSAVKRLCTVIFVTDGQPTVGEVNPDRILTKLADNNEHNLRLFTFGVGYDVNTRLLDEMADRTRAVADYIKPSEDIEVPVSRLVSKISDPALIHLDLKINGVKTDEVYPPTLPDLFYGGRLTIVGRYDTAGTGTIVLKGTRHGKEEIFEFVREFPATAGKVSTRPENTYVEKLWATRKVGWLMSQLRASGKDNSELRDELIALGNKYGIATPYTSMIVTEDEPRPSTVVQPRFPGGNYPTPMNVYFFATGEAAVRSSIAIDRMKRADSVTDMQPEGDNQDSIISRLSVFFSISL